MIDDKVFEQLREAYHKWETLSGYKRYADNVTDFFEFLGLPRDFPPQYYKMKKQGLTLPPEIMNRMQWLDSPHASTLYKAWKVQNGKP